MIWCRLRPVSYTFCTMNTPTPNFMSRVAASTPSTVSSVDERNAAITAGSPSPGPSTQNVSLSAGIPSNSRGIASSTPGVLDAPSTVNPSVVLPDLTNVQTPINTPLSVTVDSKGLESALEASAAFNSSGNSLQGDPFGPNISRSFVTAAELGVVDKLSDWLEERLGPAVVSQWGTVPGSKKLANLWSELVEGESSLEDGKPPTRTVNVACVRIRNNHGESLEEAYQEMSDGSRRERNRPLSEKIKLGEEVKDACARGIAEELGTDLVGRVDFLQETYVKKEEERDSISYPGLPTRFVIHSMEARIQHALPAEFSTGENESYHVGLGAPLGDTTQFTPLTVKRHFWRWTRDANSCNLVS